MEIQKDLKGKTGVYLILIGPHKYVGSSKNLYKRLCDHRAKLNRNAHENSYIQNAWNKYKQEFIYNSRNL